MEDMIKAVHPKLCSPESDEGVQKHRFQCRLHNYNLITNYNLNNLVLSASEQTSAFSCACACITQICPGKVQYTNIKLSDNSHYWLNELPEFMRLVLIYHDVNMQISLSRLSHPSWVGFSRYSQQSQCIDFPVSSEETRQLQHERKQDDGTMTLQRFFKICFLPFPPLQPFTPPL